MRVATWKAIGNWSVVYLILLYVSIVLGFLRIFGFKSEFYQAAAHIFVGGLFGAAIVSGLRFYWVAGVSLSVLEVVVFLAGAFYGQLRDRL